jgi:hypothetical protein
MYLYLSKTINMLSIKYIICSSFIRINRSCYDAYRVIRTVAVAEDA